MSHFISGDIIAFDTETTGLRPWHGDQPFAMAFANGKETAYFEWPVDPFTRQVQPYEEELAAAKALLEDENVVKVMHNGKFDIRMCETLGIEVAGPGGKVREGGKFDETMFMAHVCNSDEVNLKLKRLANAYCGVDLSDQDELKKAVNKLRRRAKKLGWNVAYDTYYTPKGEKIEPVAEADYWLPRVLWQQRPDLASEWEAGLCQKYAQRDVERTFLLYVLYMDIMRETNGFPAYEREMRLWPKVYRMENRGVRIDPAANLANKENAAERWTTNYTELEKCAWPGINCDSPPQMRRLLYEIVGIPVNSDLLTKTGLPSTSAAVLSENPDEPVVRLIEKFRAAGKAYNYFATYERYALPDPQLPGYAIIHADFRQIGPSTGRFSCAEPNLQQVTARDTARSREPIDCRGPFGPRPGYIWLSLDYKGMEPRIYAFAAQDQKMLEAFEKGKEIHDETVMRGWGGYNNQAGIREMVYMLGLNGSEHRNDPEVQKVWPELGFSGEELEPTEQKQLAVQYLEGFDWNFVAAQKYLRKKVVHNKAKELFFNQLYGGGVKAIMKRLKVSEEEAWKFINALDATYPRMKEYMDEMSWFARNHGYIVNLWGRRLTIDPQFTYRSVNYMIQGSAADMLKCAMIKCDDYLQESGADAHLIMTIHDELVFEVRREHLTRALILKLKSLMEDTEGVIGFPMPVDAKMMPKTWTDTVDVKLNVAA